MYKSAGDILVEIPQKFKDQLQLKNGMVLYLDTSFEKFEHRAVDGIVHSVPDKFSHIFQEGDKVFFHHSTILAEKGYKFVDWHTNIARITYTPEHTFNCLLYLIERNGERFTLNDFVFLKPIEEEKYTKVGSIFIPDTAASEKTWRAEVVYLNDFVRDSLGIDVGDVVAVTDDGRYPMEIDGQMLWRMRSDRNILAVVDAA